MLAVGFAAAVSALVINHHFQTHKPPAPFITARYNNREFIISRDRIRWMIEDDDCFYVCSDEKGCYMSTNVKDKFTVCKKHDPVGFGALSKLYKDRT